MEDKTLQAFMRDKAITYKEVTYAVSDRFLDKDGKPKEWHIKVLDQVQMEGYRNACRKKVTNMNTRQVSYEIDSDKMERTLIENCILYPNLNDAELQESWGAVGAFELVKIMLLPGEYADLCRVLFEAQGIEMNMADKIKKVKN